MMFSPNPFSQLASSTHVFPPSINSFLDDEKNGLYNNHNQWSNNTPFAHKNDKFNTSEQSLLQGLGLENCDEYYNHLFGPEMKKKSPKKDHHSKIHTSKGPRDRRVRLSIEVARKFFYLQDLLGFDKASKTLDWLFNKSKTPIVELVKRKKQSSSSSLTDQSEVVFLQSLEDGQDEQEQGLKKKRVERPKRKKITRNYKSGSPVNQSRAEARARARERTKEKLSIKKLDSESKNNVNGDCCSSNLTFQSSFWSSIESPNDYNEKIGKSIMEENISMMYSYQHNLSASNESSSSFTALPKFKGVLGPQGDRATI